MHTHGLAGTLMNIGLQNQGTVWFVWTGMSTEAQGIECTQNSYSLPLAGYIGGAPGEGKASHPIHHQT